MAPRKKKTVPLTGEGIKVIRDDKPVVYRILDGKGTNIYTGSAKRSRVEARLREHLPRGKDPIQGGKTVEINQKASIAEAQKSEARSIKRSKPKHNKRGK